MFEYVLVVYLFNDYKDPEYVGNFKTCADATQWCKTHCQEVEYTSCLHEDYIYLPKNFTKKEIE